jgi:hypothetical protein
METIGSLRKTLEEEQKPQPENPALCQTPEISKEAYELTERVIARIINRLIKDILPEEPNDEYFEKRVNMGLCFCHFKHWCHLNQKLFETIDDDGGNQEKEITETIVQYILDKVPLTEDQTSLLKEKLQIFIKHLRLINAFRKKIGRSSYFWPTRKNRRKHPKILTDTGICGKENKRLRNFRFDSLVRFEFYKGGENGITMPSTMGVALSETDRSRLYIGCCPEWDKLKEKDREKIRKKHNYRGFYTHNESFVTEGLDPDTNTHEESHYAYETLVNRDLGKKLKKKKDEASGYTEKLTVEAIRRLRNLEDEILAELSHLGGNTAKEYRGNDYDQLKTCLINFYATDDAGYSHFFRPYAEAHYQKGYVRDYLLQRDKKIALEAIDAAIEILKRVASGYEILLFTPIENWPKLLEYLKKTSFLEAENATVLDGTQPAEHTQRFCKLPSIPMDIGNNIKPSDKDQQTFYRAYSARNNPIFYKMVKHEMESAIAYIVYQSQRCVSPDEIYKKITGVFRTFVEHIGQEEFEKLFTRTWSKIAKTVRELYCKSLREELEKTGEEDTFWRKLVLFKNKTAPKDTEQDAKTEQNTQVDPQKLVPVCVIDNEAFYKKIKTSIVLIASSSSRIRVNHRDQITHETGLVYFIVIDEFLALSKTAKSRYYTTAQDIYQKAKARFLNLANSDNQTFDYLFKQVWEDISTTTNKYLETCEDPEFSIEMPEDTRNWPIEKRRDNKIENMLGMSVGLGV